MGVPKAVKYIVARPKLLAWILPIAEKYSELSGYRKIGLMYDDLLREETPVVQQALKRLPPKLAYDRAYRIRRAMQCSVTHTLLPRDQWIKADEDYPYLTPYIEEVEKEIEERSILDALTRK
jgi:ubiquinol-cytochrome c reductase subunit 7